MRYTIYSLLIFEILTSVTHKTWAEYVLHVGVMVSLTIYLIDSVVKQRQWIKTPLDLPLTLLLLLTIVAVFQSGYQPDSIRALLLFWDYLVVFYLTIHLINTRKALRQLIFYLIGISIFLVISGFLKLGGLDLFTWWRPFYMETTTRLTSVYNNPDHFAGFLVMLLPLSTGFSLAGFYGAKRILILTAIIFMLPALMMTLSRGGMTAVIFGFIWMSGIMITNPYFEKNRTIVYKFLLMFGIIILILPCTPAFDRLVATLRQGEMGGLADRSLYWQGIMDMISVYPWFGIGPGRFATIYTQYQPPGIINFITKAHNEYLQFTAEIGLGFIPLCLWLIFAFLKRGFEKLQTRSRLIRGSTLGAMTAIVGLMVHNLVDFNLHKSLNALIFTMLAAIVIRSGPFRGN